MKYAVLSMDIEDWYHLDYFDRLNCDRSVSLLDGVDNYLEFLALHDLPSSFFVLGEFADSMRGLLLDLVSQGHDVGSHGWDHVRPMKLSMDAFQQDVVRSKHALEDILGVPVRGYRAPCFSLDRGRLETLRKAGYQYDSSRILFGDHPLYGTLDMDGFQQLSANIFYHDGFFEFQVSTLAVAGRHIPVSGGGYIRIFPWFIMRRMIQSYLKQHELYVLYIHPFELSHRAAPPVLNVNWLTKKRFLAGRQSVKGKLAALVELLKENGFHVTTFAELYKTLLPSQVNSQA